MDVHPEMRELRKALDDNGVEYLMGDEEFGINMDGDVVHAEEPSDRLILDGFTHIERAVFRASDGRMFDVSYIWVLDDDGQKVFCSKCGGMGYLEVRVGIDEPYAAYADEIIEAAFGYCR